MHYVSRGSRDGKYPSVCRAAVVTAAGPNGTVSLCVMNPTGLFFDLDIAEDQGGKVGGTWHWPEMV